MPSSAQLLRLIPRAIISSMAIAFASIALACGSSGRTPPPDNPPPVTASPDVRADYVLGKMTLDEKIQLVHGTSPPDFWTQPVPRGAGSFIPGIPRLGIPNTYYADGSVGASAGIGQATALPSSIASAATLHRASPCRASSARFSVRRATTGSLDRAPAVRSV